MKRIIFAILILTGALLFPATLKDGIEYLNRKEYEKAETVFRAILKDNPIIYPVYPYLISSLYEQNKYDEALKNIKILEDSKIALSHIDYETYVKILIEKENYDRAIIIADRGVSNTRDTVVRENIRDLKLLVYFKINDLDAAEKVIKQKRNWASNPLDLYYLGEILFKRGDIDTALENLKESIRLSLQDKDRIAYEKSIELIFSNLNQLSDISQKILFLQKVIDSGIDDNEKEIEKYLARLRSTRDLEAKLRELNILLTLKDNKKAGTLIDEIKEKYPDRDLTKYEDELKKAGFQKTILLVGLLAGVLIVLFILILVLIKPFKKKAPLEKKEKIQKPAEKEEKPKEKEITADIEEKEDIAEKTPETPKKDDQTDIVAEEKIISETKKEDAVDKEEKIDITEKTPETEEIQEEPKTISDTPEEDIQPAEKEEKPKDDVPAQVERPEGEPEPIKQDMEEKSEPVKETEKIDTEMEKEEGEGSEPYGEKEGPEKETEITETEPEIKKDTAETSEEKKAHIEDTEKAEIDPGGKIDKEERSEEVTETPSVEEKKAESATDEEMEERTERIISEYIEILNTGDKEKEKEFIKAFKDPHLLNVLKFLHYGSLNDHGKIFEIIKRSDIQPYLKFLKEIVNEIEKAEIDTIDKAGICYLYYKFIKNAELTSFYFELGKSLKDINKN